MVMTLDPKISQTGNKRSGFVIDLAVNGAQ
jgi:hypothetical protein